MAQAKKIGKNIVQKLDKLEEEYDLGQTLDTRKLNVRRAVGSNPASVATGSATDGSAAVFPAQYLAPDARDKKYAMMSAMASAGRPAPIQEWEFDYLLQKTYGLEAARFHEWFLQHYGANDSNPVLKQWAYQRMPEIWDMRKAGIERNAEIQKRLANILLMGPQDEDDFKLLYGISTGTITVPKGPIWDPSGDAGTLAAPKRGVFNPKHKAGLDRTLLPTGDPTQYITNGAFLGGITQTNKGFSNPVMNALQGNAVGNAYAAIK